MIQYTEQKGPFVKQCPCSPEVVSCGYYNLNLHTGCPYDCSYCILQTYLETKEPIFYNNFDKLITDLDNLNRTESDVRIGTGELSDSLAYDYETDYSRKILEIFSDYPNIFFEFKTKSDHIRKIIHFGNPGNIIVAWSLNPQTIIRREERGSASLKQRLSALRTVQENGFKVALHFDPLLFFENWKWEYTELVREISKYLDPGRLAWWSLGALRFPHTLRQHIFSHADSILFEGELIKGLDGKYRYFKPLRMELFAYLISQIRKTISDSVPLYLCMEDRDTWQQLLPEIEPEQAIVNRYLYDAARQIG